MAESRVQRYGLLSGVVFVVLNVVGIAISGNPPKASDAGVDIIRYLNDYRQQLKLSAILFGMAVFFGLWFVAALWRVINRGAEDVQRTGVVVVVTFVFATCMLALSFVLFTAGALRADTLGAAEAEIIWTMGYVAIALSWAAVSLQMAALARHTWVHGLLPRWTVYLAAASAVTNALGVCSAGSEREYFVNAGIIGAVTWMAWIVIASIVLARRERAI
jgi:hypothetical protein